MGPEHFFSLKSYSFCSMCRLLAFHGSTSLLCQIMNWQHHQKTSFHNQPVNSPGVITNSRISLLAFCIRRLWAILGTYLPKDLIEPFIHFPFQDHFIHFDSIFITLFLPFHKKSCSRYKFLPVLWVRFQTFKLTFTKSSQSLRYWCQWCRALYVCEFITKSGIGSKWSE